MPLFFIDYWYILLVVPVMIWGFIAQARVNSTYEKYSGVQARSGITGAEAARRILNTNGARGVYVGQIQGELTDRFDPRNNTVSLSQGVYGSSSIAALGVAAHEAGHAIQHAEGYGALKLRNAIIPVTNFSSQIAPILILLGFLIREEFAFIGVGLFCVVALFQLITLPVEFNASRRALKILESDAMLTQEELQGAKKVLSAAALTYVAALALSVANILRLLLIFGGGRRRD